MPDLSLQKLEQNRRPVTAVQGLPWLSVASRGLWLSVASRGCPWGRAGVTRGGRSWAAPPSPVETSAVSEAYEVHADSPLASGITPGASLLLCLRPESLTV